jgi:predicted nucleic acid-binding protein
VRTETDAVGEMYLDTAIIIKLLVREADSAWFDAALTGRHFETSELALAEVRSALLAKERTGQITSRERVAAGEKFVEMTEEDVVRLYPLNRVVLERASALQLACHPRVPLRTLDALHVATCDLHRAEAMSTTDARMRAACEHFAIPLFPATPEAVSED